MENFFVELYVFDFQGDVFAFLTRVECLASTFAVFLIETAALGFHIRP